MRHQISQLTARRPYILRALYYWLLDNKLMPNLVVNINVSGVQVPLEYAHDNQIILNISPNAVSNLEITNEQISFQARFRGITRNILVPMGAVTAIYAKENGAGTVFESEPTYEIAPKKDKQKKKIMWLAVNNCQDSVAHNKNNCKNKSKRTKPNVCPFLHIVK